MSKDIKDIFNLEDPFDLDLQYDLYLKLIGATEDMMGPEQRVEMKRVFIAGIAQCYTIFIGDLPKLKDAQQDLALMRIEEQIMAFWKRENIRHNPNIN